LFPTDERARAAFIAARLALFHREDLLDERGGGLRKLLHPRVIGIGALELLEHLDRGLALLLLLRGARDLLGARLELALELGKALLRLLALLAEELGGLFGRRGPRFRLAIPRVDFVEALVRNGGLRLGAWRGVGV